MTEPRRIEAESRIGVPLDRGPKAIALDRWDRLGVAVRCGYSPFCGCLVRNYLLAGRRVIALGARADVRVHHRTIAVLLQTARDEALPWLWRSVCLEHTTRPLAGLRSLLGSHDPLAWRAIEEAVESASDALARAICRGKPV